MKIKNTPTQKKGLLEKAIWGLMGIVVFLIISVFIFSQHRQTSSSTTANSNQKIKSNPLYNHSVNAIVDQLPDTYTDTDGIKKYLNTQTENEVSKLQSKLDALSKSQEILLKKLAQLEHQAAATPPLPPIRKTNDLDNYMSRKAANSSLSFRLKLTNNNDKRKTTPTLNSKNNQANSTGNKNSLPNKQNKDPKLSFLNSKPSKEIYNQYAMQTPISQYLVQAGTIVNANLLTGINTSIPGHVIARVQSDIYDSVTGRYLLIPKGTKLLGEVNSNVQYGDNRILVKFNRLIRPDGSSIQMNNLVGRDVEGQAGIKAKVNNHWMRIIAAALLPAAASTPIYYLESKRNKKKCYTTITDSEGKVIRTEDTCPPSMGESALMGATKGLTDAMTKIMDRGISLKPVLTVEHGRQFTFTIIEDLIMTPYKRPRT